MMTSPEERHLQGRIGMLSRWRGDDLDAQSEIAELRAQLALAFARRRLAEAATALAEAEKRGRS